MSELDIAAAQIGIKFPLTILGYGKIENWGAWLDFLMWFVGIMQTYKAMMASLEKAQVLTDVADIIPVKVLVEISGGVLQAAWAKYPELVKLILVDHDNMKEQEGDRISMDSYGVDQTESVEKKFKELIEDNGCFFEEEP